MRIIGTENTASTKLRPNMIVLKRPGPREEIVINVIPAGTPGLSSPSKVVDVFVEYRTKKMGKVTYAVPLYSE